MVKLANQKKMGSVSTYTEELGNEICEGLATSSKGLAHLINANPHWPCAQTIFEWRLKIKSFGDKYDLAKRNQIEALVDDILNISDNDDNDVIENDHGLVGNSVAIQRSRLRVDSRKWLAGKLAPKIYGDKIQQDITVKTHEESIKDLK